MATITEDYVSFGVAKLLKEKGFPQEYDEYHSMVYNEEDYEDEYEVQRMVLETKFVKAGTLSSYPLGVPEPKCFCPTLQMAMKWLRQEKNIIVNVWYNGVDWDAKYYNNEDKNFYLIPNYSCNSYEEAIEAALKYILENLI